MTLPEVLSMVTCACAVVAALCAVMVARRAQRWRDTDEAVQLLNRIDNAESRLDVLEVQVEGVATKADMAAVKAEIHAVAGTVDRQVIPGLNRIEGYFIELGLRAK